MFQFSLKRLMVAVSILTITFAMWSAYAGHVRLAGFPGFGLSLSVSAVVLVGVGASVGILFGRTYGAVSAVLLFIILLIG
jgi:hypothetical protein